MNEYFAVIVSFVGFFVGMVVAYFSKEELVKGEKYFRWFRKVVLAGIGVVITYYAWGNPFYFVAGLVVGYFLRTYYLYLGVALGLLLGKGPFVLVLSLMFMFGVASWDFSV